jgi:hypothetical protein
MPCRTKRERTKTTLALGVITVLMFVITTVHFAAVNEYSFWLFFVRGSTSTTSPRNGLPSEVQSFATEIFNVWTLLARAHACLTD